MKELTLTRTKKTANYTIGEFDLSLGGKKVLCLELPDKNNAKQVSCIPMGEYVLKRHISPSFGDCVKVFDKDGKSEVKGRGDILIHKGNYINFNGQTDSAGCLLPVSNIEHETDKGVMGSSSAAAFLEVLNFVDGEAIKFTIKEK